MNRRRFLIVGAGSAVCASGLWPWGAHAAAGAAYLSKMTRFDDDHTADYLAPARDMDLMRAVLARLGRVQGIVGHGNFHLLGFDRALAVARGYASVERFTRSELDFLDGLFHVDARRYGFHGEKVLVRLTDEVRRGNTVRVAASGQRIFRGEPEACYARMCAAVGPSLVLTSGVRSIVKQMYLFLAKAVQSEGNLSRASRSLAPPGYSFHAVGDFDIGERGLGAANFTARFAQTRVYRRLVELGHLEMRYPRANPFGVRYEPWHVKVARR